MDAFLLFPVKVTEEHFLREILQYDFSKIADIVDEQPQGSRSDFITIGYALGLRTLFLNENMDRRLIRDVWGVLKLL